MHLEMLHVKQVLLHQSNCNWAKSSFEDLVQYNDGFKTNLIGTPQQIAERIVALKNIGVDLILSGFYTLLKRWNISEKKFCRSFVS